jgi:hypothetical protein
MTMIICGSIPKELFYVLDVEKEAPKRYKKSILNPSTSPKKGSKTKVTSKKHTKALNIKKTNKKPLKVLTKKR